jgi:hypothetical protein
MGQVPTLFVQVLMLHIGSIGKGNVCKGLQQMYFLGLKRKDQGDSQEFKNKEKLKTFFFQIKNKMMT